MGRDIRRRRNYILRPRRHLVSQRPLLPGLKELISATPPHAVVERLDRHRGPFRRRWGPNGVPNTAEGA